MIELKLDNFTSIQDIKKQLLPLNNESDFSWLMPIVNFSLDESVIIYLNNHEPSSSKFNTLNLGEHVTEATNLINNCIAKRNEIFDIETQAITLAIQYIQTINTIKDEKKVSDLNLLALFNLSKEANIDEFQKSLNSKFETASLILKAKLSLHNQKGNPLNYGEQIKYLRKIYADNIKNIYERLIAIKRTLKYSFNQETKPLPNYVEVSNNLDKLVWWMRDTIYKFEKLEQSDYIVQKSVSLSNYAISKGLNANEFLDKFRNEGSIEINISEQDFIASGLNERVRIIGVSANVIGYYDLVSEDYKVAQDYIKDVTIGNARKDNNISKRENLLFYCEATPPTQSPKIDLELLYETSTDEEEDLITAINNIDKSKILKDVVDEIVDIRTDANGKIIVKYKPKELAIDDINLPSKLVFGELQPIYKSSINTNLNFSTENSIKNASPEGIWNIKLSNVSFDANLRNEKLVGVKDFVLTFKLSVRKL